jgi:flagellar hook protein FlgE
MMRSMFAGVSGLRAHQTMTDVVANNIANVNTVGFKASRVQFADTLSQLTRGASGGTGEATAGINPQQVGLGVNVASTNKSFTQGGAQLTGRATDVAITGEGFFGVGLGSEVMYTRAGSFSFDDNGFLTDPTGGVVQGWNAAPDGTVNINEPPTGIRAPVNATVPPSATSMISMAGNLDASSGVGTVQRTATDVIDTLGESHRMSIEFEKVAANQWTATVFDPSNTSLGSSTMNFDPATGSLVAAVTPTFTFTPAGAAAFSFSLDLGTPGDNDALTQYAGAADAQAVDQNGVGIGSLRSFGIANDGTLSGVFSNGETATLAQLAIVTFSNPAGLLSAGESRFRGTNASGQALVGVPNSSGRGGISAGTLEMSNVDLSEEFTNLIIAQRGFQANSRIITVSDEMIQELVNLKR